MDIIQGFIETGNAGKSGWRIVNNKGSFGVVNKRTSNVSYSILNSGTIAAGSNFINTYSTTPAPTSSTITSTPAATTTGTTGAYTYQVFTYTTETAGAGTGQSLYTITVPSGGMVCDVLVVGGGGGGGKFGGGGGAGGVLFSTNFTLTSGTGTIRVGNGGAGDTTLADTTDGVSGKDSSITINSIQYIANGGGGGGARGPNDAGRSGLVGGSGGGGSGTNVPSSVGYGGVSNKNTYANFQSFGNNGGQGRPNVNGAEPIYSSGGGGGAGSVGSNFSYSTGGGNGGTGKDYSAYFGTSVGHSGWFGGGGGGDTFQNAGTIGFGNGGNGLLGGGGNGGFDNGIIATNALPNTGGGGGGSELSSKAGNGGSGIVIIRYLTSSASASTSSSIALIQEPNLNVITNYVGGVTSSSSGGGSSQWTTIAGSKIYYNGGNVGIGTIDPIAPLHIYNNTTTATLPTEIVVAGATSGIIAGTTDRYISFPYSGSGTTMDYTFTTTENLICDILIVGGGGAGGKHIGAGGGGGAVLYGTNINIPIGNYTIKVGKGATPGETRGASSEGFGCVILGGGSANNDGWGANTSVNGNIGGSGGGGKATGGGTSVAIGGTTGISSIGTIFGTSYTIYNGNNGGSGIMQSATPPYPVAGGGGGGTAGIGLNATSATGRGGDGGDGVPINITGVTYWWGAGGGSSTYGVNSTITGGNGGKGGGGGGGSSANGVVTAYSGTVGTNGYSDASGKNAGASTGSGGGGAGFTDMVGGNGGSGIVIIRYRKQTQASVSNARLLLDATTTGTAAIEFRRGTGGDAQNDFRIINDTNSSLKLQCENSAQFFGNTVADLAWFSSNETIIHKNTTMNGRVGIGGTTYHATRSLDVVGDANVFGAMSAGSLSAGNATITNSSSSNVSLTIQNGFVTLPNEIVVSPLPTEIVVTGTTFGTIGTTDRYISFPYSGSATTKDYTFTTTENLICDILVVGGGGCGGRSGGGGGTVLYTQNVYSPVGSYTVKVGNGGISLKTGGVGDTQGANGNDSDILFGATTIFRAKGGGFGAANNNVITGGTGGSGGGSESVGSVSVVSSANIISTNTSSSSFTTTTSAPNGTTIRGNVGGLGAIKLPGYYYYVGGGGGGAGGTGGNGNTTNNTSGAGGSGVNISITGTNIMYGSGGSGGVYNDYTQGNVPATPGNVTDGGGTGAYNINSTSYYGSIPTAGRGGGGGGWGVNVQTGEQIYPRDGGSGIIIIRYRKPPSETVTSSIIPGTTDRYISFPYSGTGATKDYTITTTENLVCDILVVGGGGGGGTRVSGGGGAGALIYVTNQSFASGTYTMKVGRGGIGAFQIINNVENPGEPGKDSEIFNNSGSVLYRAKGGGGGSSVGSYTATFTPQGGSSGGFGPDFNNGANNYISSGISPLSTNVVTINSSTTTIAPNNTSVYGYAGGGGYIFGGRYMGGGGGGAGSVGQSINTTAFTKAGDGGNAISISITGSAVAYAGGGGAGGGRISAAFTEPGTGGSINGTRVGGIGGYLKVATTFNGIAYPAEGVGGDAVANTGSGGGGAGSDDIAQSMSVYKAGSGGSGIIILRYRKLTTSSSTSLELTSSSSTSIIEPQLFNVESIYPPYRYFTYNDTNGIYTVQNGSIEAGNSTNFSYTYSYNDPANTQGNNEQTSSTLKYTHGMGLYKFSVGGTQTAGGTSSGLFIYGLSSDYDLSTSGNRPGVNNDDNQAALPNGPGWYVGTGWSNSTTYNSSYYYNATFAGAWIKIELPIGIVFSSFKILGGYQKSRAPKAFKIYGSNTNTTTAADWTLLHTETNYTYNAGGDFGIKQTVTNNLMFKNYLMVVSEQHTYDSGLLVFQGWYIYGKEKLEPVVINSDYKYLSFTHSGGTETQTSYTVNFSESTLCDILVVGGGGGGGYSYVGGGGGGGGYVYLQNVNFPSGSYTVNVGSGGAAGVNGASPAGWGGNGANSSITGAINYIALGGGGGAGGSAGGIISGIGSNGGSGGGGAYKGTTGASAGGISTQFSTYGYGNGGSGNSYLGTGGSPGGGGGGASGITNGSSPAGNNGLANSITGVSITYAGGGGAGLDTSTPSSGGTGGGGAGATGSGTIVAPVAGTDGLGGGGGGARGGGTGVAAKGGSGIVIIRYKSSKAGNQTYKVGNFNGEFKVISSVSNTDTDYIKITTAGAITNPTGTASWNTGSDRRIKENIERASYDKCLDNINKLELNRFNYIDGFNTVNRDKTQLGFIAQEVSDIFPKSISSQEYYSNTLNIPDLLSIDITQINYSLYGAVKKLIEINIEKDIRIITLNNRIKILKNLLNITDDAYTSNLVIDANTSNIASNE